MGKLQLLPQCQCLIRFLLLLPVLHPRPQHLRPQQLFLLFPPTWQRLPLPLLPPPLPPLPLPLPPLPPERRLLCKVRLWLSEQIRTMRLTSIRSCSISVMELQP
jgi:hypothetical protein